MAHLEKLPTWFVKGNKRQPVYFSVIARELQEDGWVEEGEKAAPAKINKPLPEILVEAGVDAYDTDSLKSDDEVEFDLSDLTKAELLDWAQEQGHDLKNSLSKAEIFELCEEILAKL